MMIMMSCFNHFSFRSLVCVVLLVFSLLLGPRWGARDILSRHAMLIRAAKCTAMHEAEETCLHRDRGFEISD